MCNLHALDIQIAQSVGSGNPNCSICTLWTSRALNLHALGVQIAQSALVLAQSARQLEMEDIWSSSALPSLPLLLLLIQSARQLELESVWSSCALLTLTLPLLLLLRLPVVLLLSLFSPYASLNWREFGRTVRCCHCHCYSYCYCYCYCY